MSLTDPKLSTRRTAKISFRRAAVSILGASLLASLLSACDYKVEADCATMYAESPDLPSSYLDAGRGLVTHVPSATTWLRCPAGMTFGANGSCRGEPLLLPFEEALAYAEEVSEKSGQTIRLPTVGELRALRVDSCVNPSIDIRAFPAAQVENNWTSESSRTTSLLACAVYLFQGNSSCRESKATPYPFMLMLERD